MKKQVTRKMDEKTIFQKLGFVHTCFFLYIFLCALAFLTVGRNICVWQMWNSFLAWVPFVLIQLYTRYHENKLSWILLFFGVLFLPNAFYMITSFIHANNLNFYQLVGGRALYVESITPWVEIILISIGALFGCMVGFKSMKLIVDRFKGAIITPLVLSLLSGFGIWIGRFLRFNSWDIFRPFFLVEHTVARINWFTVSFSLLFALFIFAGYMLIYKVDLKKLFGEENEIR